MAELSLTSRVERLHGSVSFLEKVKNQLVGVISHLSVSPRHHLDGLFDGLLDSLDVVSGVSREHVGEAMVVIKRGTTMLVFLFVSLLVNFKVKSFVLQGQHHVSIRDGEMQIYNLIEDIGQQNS